MLANNFEIFLKQLSGKEWQTSKMYYDSIPHPVSRAAEAKQC